MTDDQRWQAVHHPFTSAQDEDWDRLESDPGSVLAKAYDVVLNGWEIGGGSIRIHRSDLQDRLFARLGLTAEETRPSLVICSMHFSMARPPTVVLPWASIAWWRSLPRRRAFVT